MILNDIIECQWYFNHKTSSRGLFIAGNEIVNMLVDFFLVKAVVNFDLPAENGKALLGAAQ